jgi:hypothetical protein
MEKHIGAHGLPRASIAWQVDSERRLLVLEFIGDVSGEMAVAEIPRIWAQHPEVIGYDTLVDRTSFTGLIEHSHIQEIAAAWHGFCGGRDAGKRTAFVSTDAMSGMRAKAVFTEFPAQRYAVFPTRAAALEWLENPAGDATSE